MLSSFLHELTSPRCDRDDMTVLVVFFEDDA